MLGLDKFFKKRPKKWINRPQDLPWSDQPTATKAIDERTAKGEISAPDAALLHKWLDDGYVVLERCVSKELLDAYNAEIEALWHATTPRDGIFFLDVFMKEGEWPVAKVAHADLVALPIEERLAIRARGKWRIHGYHLHSEVANKVFQNPDVKRLVSLILGLPTEPTYSISFFFGSTQPLHQDMMVFHIHPLNYLVGVWIAMEDISPDSGPLVYYPKSHREPVYSEYSNYPQSCLRTSDPETRKRYEAHLDEVASKYERKEFIAKAGDALLWHAMLLHGGSPIKRADSTRKSFVIHYLPPQFDKSSEVVGPFMW